MGTGTAALAGAIFGIVELRSILPGHVAMKGNTAIALILLGIALRLLDTECAIGRLRRSLAQVLSLSVAALGVVSFAEYLYGWDFGIDQFIFREPVEQAMGSVRAGFVLPGGLTDWTCTTSPWTTPVTVAVCPANSSSVWPGRFCSV